MRDPTADRAAVWRADGLLLLTAALWGTGFVAQREASVHLDALTYNASRFVVATLALLPIALRWGRQTPPGGWTGGRAWAAGAAAGAVLFLASWLQQAGVAHTTAGNAGFITGLYVILVPILGWFGGTRPAIATWPAAGLAVVGLYLLSGTSGGTLGRGDTLVLASALVWALHVLLVGRFAPRMNGVQLAWQQMAFAAVLSLLVAVPTGGIPGDGLKAATGPILYNGLVCGAVAYTLQILGQRHAPPAHAALLMSLEAVSAALFGGLLLDEHLGVRGWLGCLLMLLGCVIIQVPLVWRRPSEASAAGMG